MKTEKEIRDKIENYKGNRVTYLACGQLLQADILTAKIEELYWVLEDDKKHTPPLNSDNVNHPTHYQGKHECIDEMIALFGIESVKAFCKCNVYKYKYRADKKNGKEDLDKADWYMDKLIELKNKE